MTDENLERREHEGAAMSARMSCQITSLAIGPTAHPNATAEDCARLWNACDYPERPPDEWVMYHVMPDCHGCNVAKEAAKRAAESTPKEPRQ